MINGMHALIYSTDPEADRAFLRDGLGWSFVEDHPGWLIFRLPPAEVASTRSAQASSRGTSSSSCATTCTRRCGSWRPRVRAFAGEIQEAGFGLLTQLVLPSGARIGLYEPRHQIAADITS